MTWELPSDKPWMKHPDGRFWHCDLKCGPGFELKESTETSTITQFSSDNCWQYLTNWVTRVGIYGVVTWNSAVITCVVSLWPLDVPIDKTSVVLAVEMRLQNMVDHWSTSMKIFTRALELMGTMPEWREDSHWKPSGFRSRPLVKTLLYSASHKYSWDTMELEFGAEIHKGAAAVAIMINSSTTDVRIWEIKTLSVRIDVCSWTVLLITFEGMSVDEEWTGSGGKSITLFPLWDFLLGLMTEDIW